MGTDTLRRDFELLRAEATRLAGTLTDLAQRATVYHHLYRASGGNHIFPLIAAHGALWAGGYFRRALRLGRLLAWQYGWSAALRREKLAQLDDFANAFRDINRRVCVDTYASFHFTRTYGRHARAAEFVTPSLLAVLNAMHDAQQTGRPFTDEERQAVFVAHFLDEQEHVVGPAIRQAVKQFEWPLVHFLALRPRIQFAYFPGQKTLQFRNFARQEERVSNGLRAFAFAQSVGWTTTENSLRAYTVLPAAFFANPVAYFAELRTTILAAA